MQNFGDWLNELGLGAYAELFAAQKIDRDLLASLNDADLKELGVASFGDRKRLLRAVASLSASGQAHANQAPVPPTPVAVATAERRQLTVMFCDLVGSTELATVLDPEDLRSVIGAYHDAVAGAVGAHNGYVAQLLGDGVLVYFGYPQANEDDAASAIHAAADVIAAVSRLTTIGRRTLHTRIGIATGLVVVGEIGAGTPAAELSASGETPNLAARLQSQATSDRIVIADQTRKLIGDAFELEPLGLLTLKGFDAPVQAWQVLGERQAESRFEASHTHQLSHFVGRDSEVALLLERWSTACEGEGQTVLLSGEPGIGKSRIAHMLRKRVRSTGTVESVLLQCSPYHRNSTLYPVVHALEIAARLTPAHSPSERAARLAQYLTDHGVSLAPAALDCLLRLMTLPDEDRPVATDQTPQQQKAAMLQALTSIVAGLSLRAPVLLIVEDAHWIDPTTEEWMGRAIDQLRDARVLMVITSRPEYVPSWGSPLNATRLTMNRLSQRQSAVLIGSVSGGKPLPAEAIKEIIRKTDGVPLFIEELTKTVLASQFVEETPTGYRLRGPLHALAIPSTLQDSLMARLDRLGPAKEVAQVAAAIGRDFGHGLLAEVLQMQDAPLEHALDELLRAELVFRRGTAPDTSYAFKHALIRDTAYNSMVRSQRTERHAQIAQALERTAPEFVAVQPELLAQHHQEAGHDREAIRYWTAAGDLAWSRSVGREATVHYATAIALVTRLPANATRSELELSLQLKRGHALEVTDGYGSQATYQSFETARELARELGRIEDFVSAWSSSAPAFFGAGRVGEVIERMKEIGPSQLAALAPRFRVVVMTQLGVAHFMRAEIDEAWDYLEAARLLDDVVKTTHEHPVGGADPAVVLRTYGARIMALRGYLKQAETLARQAMQIADSRGHPHTIAWAKLAWVMVLLLKGEHAQAESISEQALELSERFGFKNRIASGSLHLGRARVALGEVEVGLAVLRKGYDLWASVVGKFHHSEHGAQAAHALLRAGRDHEARQFIVDAQAVQATTDERFCEAELLRLSGQILEIDGDVAGAEAHYQNAILIAEKRGLKLFSLRAACDLGRLQQRHGRNAEAQHLLRPLYAWFTEGLDFTDLREAKALLDSLKNGHVSI